jgi:hypothetical protein
VGNVGAFQFLVRLLERTKGHIAFVRAFGVMGWLLVPMTIVKLNGIIWHVSIYGKDRWGGGFAQSTNPEFYEANGRCNSM